MEQFSLEKYLANPSRKVVTRDGRKVRILCTDAKGNYPVIALIESIDNTVEISRTFSRGGVCVVSNMSDDDLFFAPEKHEGWINIYRDFDGNHYVMYCPIFTSKEEAEKKGKCYIDYVTTIKTEWE